MIVNSLKLTFSLLYIIVDKPYVGYVPDDSQRRITLVLENLFENNGTYIAEIYLERHLLEDLSYKEANALLVKSSPRERKDVILRFHY